MKKICLCIAVLVAMTFCLAGCMNLDYSYENADKYTAGDRESFIAATRAARYLEKKRAMDLYVEFDAGKLYNNYVNFAEKQFEHKGQVACPRRDAVADSVPECK